MDLETNENTCKSIFSHSFCISFPLIPLFNLAKETQNRKIVYFSMFKLILYLNMLFSLTLNIIWICMYTVTPEGIDFRNICIIDFKTRLSRSRVVIIGPRVHYYPRAKALGPLCTLRADYHVPARLSRVLTSI